MTPKTIRNVHSILSGAFATAKHWEWIAWNPLSPLSHRLSRGARCPPEDAATAQTRARSSTRKLSPPPGLVSMPRQQKSLGSERGLATPSPDGKGEITLSPSIKIMPFES